MPLRFIVRRFASWVMLGFIAGIPAFAHALATAQGVALNGKAGCTTADLDLTLTTAGATREFGLATNLAGATLSTFEQDTAALGTFSGTFSGYVIGPVPANPTPWPPQPAGTLISSYAYVGTTPPTAATTSEFFVYYNCSTQQVLLACYGPYGTCPQTAQQAQAAISISIPTLDKTGLALAMMLLAVSALFALRRRG